MAFAVCHDMFDLLLEILDDTVSEFLRNQLQR